MTVRDAIQQRMIKLSVDHCAGVKLSGKDLPIVTDTDPVLDEELGDRTFMLLGEMNAQQAGIELRLVRTPSHVCYDGCEELEY